MQNTTQDRDPQPTEVNMQDPLDQLELIQRIKELIINDAQALYGPQVTGHTYSVIFSVEALPESQSSDGQPKRQSLTAQLILYVSPHPPARWVLLATSESKGSLVEAVDNLRINVQVEVGKVTQDLDVGDVQEGSDYNIHKSAASI
ncbi:hypothetical protein BU24DRAFT_418184 [Aaosphaeria arxii CBS 175.79]|uniref:Uncharacterized protein n=1 Tax=Aaosphaeria arxii CBS 175.79 TaxID=1450172 RepID=A0A6A5Y169_9PLEO|nr:uncharacterized protein BU24DRAFT_418184 [Aaosphaeria arxii CBS 175.79]KAF2018661.1 hypothetical protein BU24DRAFT_418184 [Aaosphaeria arxii CBS 175.79]